MALYEIALGRLAFNAAGAACRDASINVHLVEREAHFQADFAFLLSEYFDSHALRHMGIPPGHTAIVEIQV